MRWRPVFCLLLAACAAARPVSSDVPPPPTEEVVATEQPLESAWEPPGDTKELETTKTAVPDDVSTAFAQTLSEARRALQLKDNIQAATQAQLAFQLAQQLDADARLRAGQTLFSASKTNAETAESAAVQWLLACGPDKALSCRNQALDALTSVAKSSQAQPALKQRVVRWQDAEHCASLAERGQDATACQHAALSLSKSEGDDFLAQRLLVAQALKETNDSKQLRLLERAERACDKPQCAHLRMKAIRKLLTAARTQGDIETSTRLALREVAAGATVLPESRRTWARTKTLDAECKAYDARKGAGSCRDLEREVLGHWTFHDFSKELAGEGLNAERVRSVGNHYAPLLQQCLKEEADRARFRGAQQYEIQWVIRNDGQVSEAHLRKDLDSTPLAECVRAQFRFWRYPRFTGEYQNIEQTFTVTANTRR